jgi:DNA-binding transcriptional regulator YiaG
VDTLITLRTAAIDRNGSRAQFDAATCRALRTAAGLTATDLAAICGTVERTVERWENGERNPNPQALVRLERVLAALTLPDVA